MRKKDKLLERLLTKPKDFTMGDMDSRFHRPHPSNELPGYVLNMAIEFLKNEGEIK